MNFYHNDTNSPQGVSFPINSNWLKSEVTRSTWESLQRL